MPQNRFADPWVNIPEIQQRHAQRGMIEMKVIDLFLHERFAGDLCVFDNLVPRIAGRLFHEDARFDTDFFIESKPLLALLGKPHVLDIRNRLSAKAR